jgi:hypothetical protein
MIMVDIFIHIWCYNSDSIRTLPEVLIHIVATFTLSNTFRSGIVPTWFRTGPPYWLPVFFCFLSLKTRHRNFSSFFCPAVGLHANFFLGLLFIFIFWIYFFFSFLFSRRIIVVTISFDNSILH